jgi:hypothetical protein
MAKTTVGMIQMRWNAH